jgi:acyl carrier protein
LYIPDAVTDPGDTVIRAIRSLLERRGDVDVDIRPDSALQDDLGLDSLELAELSAHLEDELGRDPYSEGIVPRTVEEVLAFYQA